MKRHKSKDSSGKNRIFYIHATNVNGPLPSIEDVFSVEGPEAKEDFEDFRFDDWDNQVMQLSADQIEDGALLAMTKHGAERLYSMLGKVLGK